MQSGGTSSKQTNGLYKPIAGGAADRTTNPLKHKPVSTDCCYWDMKNLKLYIGVLAIAFGTLSHVQAQDPLTNGLVAYYPFKGDANDLSGMNNHGSIVGADNKFLGDRFGFTNSLWLNTTSPPGWDFDGTYAEVPRDGSLNFNDDFTLSLWVNFTNDTPIPNGVSDQGYAHNLFSNGSDGSSMNLRIITDNINYDGKDYLQLVAGGINLFAILPPVRHTWWQITVVRSGTKVSLYKNGSVRTNGTFATIGNNPSIWLGRHQGSGSTYPLVGGIDDVRIFNRALSNGEVQALFQYEFGLRMDLVKAVKPAFSNLYLGTNYQLQVSGDMNTWTNHGSAFIATNEKLVYPQYFEVGNADKLFFRLIAP
jgi:hypothetical protein